MTEITTDWVPGGTFGLDLPAHPAALQAGGADFLTHAFRRSGALAADNRVTRITGFEPWGLGGTGVKLMLSVEYERSAPDLAQDLPQDLFVKFSRNFDDPVRDSGRHHMLPEVDLANLSRHPDFPVAVPCCLYADIDPATQTGLLITARIPYGEGAVEPHHPKCMDHVLPEPLEHYGALVACLGRLAGTHKSGRLGAAVEQRFPLDIARLIARRPRVEAAVLAKRINRLAAFIGQYPHLFPAHVADGDFLQAFCRDAMLVVERQDAVWREFHAQPDVIALCHMNAHVDNAWFWRDPHGALQAGLIDWGGVGQMSVASSFWGCVGAAEPELHDRHLGALLKRFVQAFAEAGGPAVDPALLERHVELHVLMSALHMTTAPPAILREIPDPACLKDRFDPVLAAYETARVQLKVTVALLNMWATRDLGRYLRGDHFV